jgi:hypothetical protein
MEIKKCELCEQEFEINPKLKRERVKRFCSGTCAKSFNGSRNKGKKLSDTTRLKMSEAKKGEKNHFFGKSHSQESKQIIANKVLERAQDLIKEIEITEYEKEILDGMMLADASICDQSSISARIGYGCKFKKTLEDVSKELDSIKFGKPFSYTSKPHVKSGKKYTSWFIKSEKNNTLLKERLRWYPNGKKIVPEDVRITHNSCYWWFIGDGYNQYGRIMLCTESFSKKENYVLIEKLKQKGFDANYTSRNRISITKSDSKKFIKWILKDRNIAQHYKYKLESIEINGNKRKV